MRPAQLTPENKNSTYHKKGDEVVSMRPAQLTPENDALAFGVMADGAVSMRSAQLTPENHRGHVLRPAQTGGFNEAGAINAGKLRRITEPKADQSMFQ